MGTSIRYDEVEMRRENDPTRTSVATTAALAVAAALGAGVAAAEPGPALTSGVPVTTVGSLRHHARIADANADAGASASAGVGVGTGAARGRLPRHDDQAFLVKLSTRSTEAILAHRRSSGLAVARAAARAQLATVRRAQQSLIGALPDHAKVLHRTHAAVAAVGGLTKARDLDELRSLRGVRAVYPIAAKRQSNS